MKEERKREEGRMQEREKEGKRREKKEGGE